MTAQRRRSRSIPGRLHRAVVERLGDTDPETGRPFTARVVSTWLRVEHDVNASYMAVLRVRADVDAQGRAALVEAIREELRDAVKPALVRLKRALKRLDALAIKSKSVKDVAAATNATTRALHELAQLGGVAAPIAVDVTQNGQPLDVAVARFAESLARLGVATDEGAAGSAADDAPG